MDPRNWGSYAVFFFWQSMGRSDQFSCSVMSDSFWPHESQHARPPCPSQTSGVYSNPCPSSWWCHPAISSSVFPFSSCPQSLPASGSFPMSQLFAWHGQIIGVSALVSVFPMNTQDLSPLGWTGWISLQSKGLSRVFSNFKKYLNCIMLFLLIKQVLKNLTHSNSYYNINHRLQIKAFGKVRGIYTCKVIAFLFYFLYSCI